MRASLGALLCCLALACDLPGTHSDSDDGCFEWSDFDHTQTLTVSQVRTQLEEWGETHPEQLQCGLLCVGDANTDLASCEFDWFVDFPGGGDETSTSSGGDVSWDEGLEPLQEVGTLRCVGRYYNECVA